MSKPTINDNFSGKRSPTNFKSQDKADISSQQLKSSKLFQSDTLEDSNSTPSKGKKIRPSSWDESDNEFPPNDESPNSNSGLIYSMEMEKNSELAVADKLDKIKEQFFHLSKTDVSEDSPLNISEFSRTSKSPERNADSKLKIGNDRRHTPARVRRRTRSSSSSSPRLDSTNFQEFTDKTGICDSSPHQDKKEIEVSLNNSLDNPFSDLLNKKTDTFYEESSTLQSKANFTAKKDEKNNDEEKKFSEILMKETASEEDFYYCRTLRKLSQILEVEEGRKEAEGNGREENDVLDENEEEKLSESSFSQKSLQELDNNTLSPVFTSCNRKPSTHDKLSPERFFTSKDAVLLEKLTNVKRNSKGSLSDRTYRPVFKNSESNGFIILTPKSAKTDIDINDDDDLEFEKSSQDLTKYSYIDSVWNENFLKNIKQKESQEDLHIRISIPKSEETSPRKNKDSSRRSKKTTRKSATKNDSPSLNISPPSSGNTNKISPKSLKIEDVKTPNSEKGNDNIKRERRREKIKKSFSVETTTLNKTKYVKRPKSLQSEEMNFNHQKSDKRNFIEDLKTDSFKLKSINYISPKLPKSFEKSQSVDKSLEENFSSKLEKSGQSSPNSTKSHSPKISKNDLNSSSEIFKKDSGRSFGSNNSSVLLGNNLKENNTWFQRLKSPASELGFPSSLESPQYQTNYNISDRSEDSFSINKFSEPQKYLKLSGTAKTKTKKQESVSKKNSNNSGINLLKSSNQSSARTSNFDDPKSISDSECDENFQKQEKPKSLDVQKMSENNSNRSEVEFTENQTDTFLAKNKMLLADRKFQEGKEMKNFEENESESLRSEEEFKEDFLFYGGEKNLKQAPHSSRASLYDQSEKIFQKIDDIIDSRRESNCYSKSSSKTSARSYTTKTEEENSDIEKARSKSSSRKSSHRTLSIIDETSHEAFLKNAESFEEVPKIQSRSSSCRSPQKLENFTENVNGKVGNRDEKEISSNKADRNASDSIFSEDVNKKKREKNSFEEIMWQDLIERFDDIDENFSTNSSAINKFPGFPQKHSMFQNSRESITSSYEIQNKFSKLENESEKNSLELNPKEEEEKEKILESKNQSADSFLIPETEKNQEKLDKRNPYFHSEHNNNKDQQSKMFYFDVKTMDNQKIGEFGDVTCCSIGKFEITTSGKPNIYGDGDQGVRTSWDQIAASSLIEKTQKDIEKKPQRQLWTEVNSNYEFKIPVLNTQQIQKADLNFKEYFPVSSFKVLSATIDSYQNSRSVKSLTEEIHSKGDITTPILNQKLCNSLKNVTPLEDNCNENTLKQSIYTSTGDLFEMTFQNITEENEFSNLKIFSADKKKCDKSVKPKNWLIRSQGKYENDKSIFRKSRIKKKENSLKVSLHAIKGTSSARSKPSIPPLRFKNSNCFQNFYKRLISSFCITSHSSAATSK